MAGDEVLEPGSPEDHADSTHDGPTSKKKKKFGFFKRLFVRKRTKSRDEGLTPVSMTATKSQSMSDMVIPPDPVTPENHPSTPQPSNKLSISDDSIFTPEAKKQAEPVNQRLSRIKMTTTSMEVIPQPAMNELAQKLRGRGKIDPDDEENDDEQDDGLPGSPPSHLTTADVLMESGLSDRPGNRESDHSLGSMDSSENELDEFFHSGWKDGRSQPPPSQSTENLGSDIDLDAIPKDSQPLVNVAAKHRRDIKPPRSQRHRTKSTSPKPTGGVLVLPKLKEELAAAKPAEDTQSEDEKDTNKDNETGEMMLGAEEDLEEVEVKDEVEKPQNEVDEVRRSPEPLPYSRPASDSDTGKASTAAEVVLRRTSQKVSGSDREASGSSPTRHDSSKRQTVAVSSEVQKTIFGERKLTKRSSIHDTQNWEDLDKPKSPVKAEVAEEKENDSGGNTEFAQMFNRFKRQASQKKIELVADDSKPASGGQEKKEQNKVLKITKKKKVPTATLR